MRNRRKLPSPSQQLATERNARIRDLSRQIRSLTEANAKLAADLADTRQRFADADKKHAEEFGAAQTRHAEALAAAEKGHAAALDATKERHAETLAAAERRNAEAGVLLAHYKLLAVFSGWFDYASLACLVLGPVTLSVPGSSAHLSDLWRYVLIGIGLGITAVGLALKLVHSFFLSRERPK